ncbi:preprotein translocase subunit YajC [Thermosulfidibacter takaii ABI70S6]|uniref:Sec translocon accessory complex subunit YajC n=1 Tax=Thermosulfidibacter takaii (strain DSM 17441 / JCM 13301 / NBRC 103674 / ABI70S6) TaxID=1298851 RepID=A0A0S3QS85_THET7|nr:preprotein translocase subunit YajC [Thermosulfidibacter takaii]BAT71211.1 preprotein translocase subunit YajC [Thermosulfidibacter takaii ABI70S6]
MLSLLVSVAYAAGSATASRPSGWIQLIPLILIFVVFWFILIWPQQRRQKQHRKMLESLKKGDKVVTIGGIYGVVTHIGDNTVIIKVDDNTKLEVSKAAIANIVERKS